MNDDSVDDLVPSDAPRELGEDGGEGGEGGEGTTRPRVPAEVLRRVREVMGLPVPEVARALRVGRSSYYRFEAAEGGVPPWLLLALSGLGVAEYGRRVSSMMALFGVHPDEEPARTPEGTYAPFIPTLDQIDAGRDRAYRVAPPAGASRTDAGPPPE